MKSFGISCLLWAFLLASANGQRIQIDSLKHLLTKKQPDTSRVRTLIRLSNVYLGISPDSSIQIAKEAIELARQINFAEGQMRATVMVSKNLQYSGDLPASLAYEFDILKMARAVQHRVGVAATLYNIGTIYGDLGDARQALTYLSQSRAVSKAEGLQRLSTIILTDIASVYIQLSVLDSAQLINQQAQQQLIKNPDRILQAVVLLNFGRIEVRKGNRRQAFRFFRQALPLTQGSNRYFDYFDGPNTRAWIELELAQLFDKQNQLDSALYYAHQALLTAQGKNKLTILQASQLLTKFYKANHQIARAFYYQEMSRTISDSVFGAEKFRQLQKLLLTQQQHQQTLLAEQERYQKRIQIYGLLIVLAGLLLIAGLLWRTNQLKTKSNLKLHQQNEEINRQRHKVESALSALQTTQAQLIQKEKLASLGELTAGIAHEIQNPLNFVNNFSEVSTELIDEFKNGPFQLLPDTEKEYAEEILSDLTSNLQKINHHGGRASSIVKGMLEHSRTESGEKRPTDLNALADEYLKIAYHGLRAKDKDFTCELVTDFDPTLELVDVAPQEIGRVLLNLYNNAFYAVAERAKQGQAGYQPTVQVSTNRTANGIQIRVHDNGTGISDAVKAKIFQPFFTTKPTGEGTGLGLSLSYDIVTKGHGGTLTVETEEVKGTEFIIGLPMPA